MINYGTAYVLRTCSADMTSRNDFKWPESGYVEAPDWKKNQECGHGLHGFLWGAGDFTLADWSSDAKWLVVKIDHWIDLDGKVKFKGGEVVYAGDRATATSMIYDLGSQAPIIGLVKHSDGPLNIIAGYRSTLTAGDRSTLTAGDRSTLTAGDDSTLTAGSYSTLTAGDRSTLTAGDRSTLTAGDDSTLTAGYRSTLTAGSYSTLTAGDHSTLTAGDDSTLTAGYRSTLTAGDDSTLTAGYRSTLTAGYRSTLTAGDDSTLTAGYRSTLTAGYRSTLTAGDDSTLTAGDDSTLTWKIWDGVRYRLHTFCTVEGGCKADTAYCFIDGKLIEVAK